MSTNTHAKSEYVENVYREKIQYYWKSSRKNKRYYKWTRTLTVVLGATVTLIASLSSAQFVKESDVLGMIFSIATPVLAALLAVAGGFSQHFQWGATWKDMVMTAQRLENERDRFLVTKPEERDLVKEVKILHNYVITESQSFFQRIIGTMKSQKP